MNERLSTLVMILFGLLPPALLSLRMFPRRRLPWWAVVTIMVVTGWGLVLGAAMLAESPEGGSAAMVFALFFGWAYALVWFAPWLGLYGLVALVRRRFRQSAKEEDHRRAA